MLKNKIIEQGNALKDRTQTLWGFNLAEVLITLSIIGVVAAMTMPTLINKTNNLQYKVAYKKAYATMNNAILMAKADNALVQLIWTNVDVDDSQKQQIQSPQIGENFKLLSDYIKTTKKCFDNNADACWYCDGQSGFLFGSGNPEWTGCDKSSYAFIDASGTNWYLYSNRENAIVIDVNGFKSPNKLGKDRYLLQFGSNSIVNNTGEFDSVSKEINAVKPHIDLVNKERWCPDGNCLYYSALYN